jgi:hypothetical protein
MFTGPSAFLSPTLMLELRAGNWEEKSLYDDEVDFMIAAVCSG